MSATPAVLRPMGVGDILDRAISTYRQNFLTLLGIVAVVNVPLLLVDVAAGLWASPSLFSANPFPTGAPTLSGSLPFIVYPLITFLTALLRGIAFAFETAALAVVISEFYLGRKLSFLQAYGSALRRGFPLLVALLLQGVIIVVLTVIALVPFFGLAIMSSTLGNSSNAGGLIPLVIGISCLALIPAIVLAIFLYVRWAFVYQSIALEKLGPLRGLGRSWDLVRGSFWRVLGISILLNIFVYIVSVVPTTVVSFSAVLISPASMLSSVASSAVSLITTTLVLPIQIAVLTLLYYDLRIRKEGFDLEMMAKQLEVPAPASLPEPNT